MLNLYLINVKMLMKNDAIINQLVFILCETLILYVYLFKFRILLLLISLLEQVPLTSAYLFKKFFHLLDLRFGCQ